MWQCWPFPKELPVKLLRGGGETGDHLTRDIGDPVLEGSYEGQGEEVKNLGHENVLLQENALHDPGVLERSKSTDEGIHGKNLEDDGCGLPPENLLQTLDDQEPIVCSPFPEGIPEEENCLVVPVRIGKTELAAVIDSGAQLTIINEELAKQCIEKEPVDTVQLRGISQQFTTGKVYSGVEIQIGGQKFRGNVISASMTEDMLLGADFLLAMKVKIDFGLGRLEINGEIIQAKLLVDQDVIEVNTVKIARTVKVPPNSVKLVEVYPTRNPDTNFVIVPIREASSCLIPSSFHGIAGPVIVQCINDLEETVTLEKGLVIGIAEDAMEVKNDIQETPSKEFTIYNVKETKLPPHLGDLFERSTTGLAPEETKKVKELLISFQDVFSTHDLDIGCFGSVPHKIELKDPNVEPVKEKIRRTPKGFENEEEKHLTKMLELGVIQPSESAWASAPVLIRKKDGSVCWCLDYRKLNSLTKKDAFPLPLISDCLDALSDNKYMSTLDMASGYWQIQVNPL